MNVVTGFANWLKDMIPIIPKEKDNPNNYKILVVGERAVGKSSVIKRYLKSEFNLEIKSTMQSELYSTIVGFFDKNIKIEIKDICTDDIKVEHSYLYDGAKAAIIVYDVTKRKSFNKIDSWIADIRQIIGYDKLIFLLGNKTDLKYLKSIHTEELREKAFNFNCDYMEITCTKQEEVDRAMNFIISKIYYMALPQEEKKYFVNSFK